MVMGGKRPINVLVTDDSPLFRQALISILEEDPEIHVVGTASDGREAVEKTQTLAPDLVIMDLQMPVMGGLKAIELIMAKRPTPILVYTSDTSEQAAFQALERGALDLIRKPRNYPESVAEGARISNRIKMLSSVRVVRHMAGSAVFHPRPVRTRRPASRGLTVAIAGSTGGPRVLRMVLSGLPAEFPAPILVVQHIVEGFSAGLAEWLDHECAVTVCEAQNGNLIRPGRVYIAPDRFHMTVARGERILLDRLPPREGHRPSATLLFMSMARVYGPRAVGVVLTGMGRDGAEGMREIYRQGGRTITQDAMTSVVYGMPKAAVDLGVVQRQLPMGEISGALIRLVWRDSANVGL